MAFTSSAYRRERLHVFLQWLLRCYTLSRVHTEQRASWSDMKDWQWAQDPKILVWIIGALVFLIWVVLQRP